MKIRLLMLIAVATSLMTLGVVSRRGFAQPESITAHLAMPFVDTLEPATVSRFDLSKRDLIENLFAGLTRLNARSGQVEPHLATEWTVSPDGYVWTFNLRHDVQWTEWRNGEVVALRPVVAGDVVFAIQRACDPNRPSPVTSNLFVIAGCRDTALLLDTWRVNDSFLNEQIGVRALDDYTVEFHLAYPAAYFLTLATLAEFRPLPREYIVGNNQWPVLGISPLITSGPWVIREWNTTHLLLQLSPFWPLERQGNLEYVDIHFDLDVNTLPPQITSGGVDVARVNQTTVQTVNDANLVKVIEGQTLYLIGFSFEYPPLENPLVRQALAQAIDRDQLATQLAALGQGTYLRMNRFTPRNVVATPTIQGLGFDPVAAQQILANAGYPGCTGFPAKITLVVENTDIAIAVGQFVAQQWQQHLGCSETFMVATASRQALVDTAHMTVEADQDGVVSRFQTWLVTWTGDYPDANAWTSDALHCRFGFLRTGRICDINDTLLDQAAAVADLQSRFTTYSQAEAGFFGSGGSFPVIPLVLTSEYLVQQPWITGIANYGPFQFDRWRIE